MPNKEVRVLLARKKKALRREMRAIWWTVPIMLVLVTFLGVLGFNSDYTHQVVGVVLAGAVTALAFTLLGAVAAAWLASGQLSKRLIKTQTVKVDGTDVRFDHEDAWRLCDDEKVPAALRDTLRESLLILDKQIVAFSKYAALWPDVSTGIVYNTVRCYHTVLTVKKAQHEADIQARYAFDAERSDNLVEQVRTLAREVDAKMLR